MKKMGLLTAIVICLCIVGAESPVYAQTVDFNITVTDSTRKDPISKRAQKADNEQKYYLTVTGGTGNGVLRAHSQRLDGGVISVPVNISAKSAGVRYSSKYYTTANSGAYYFLNSYWSSGTGEVNLWGRYTP